MVSTADVGTMKVLHAVIQVLYSVISESDPVHASQLRLLIAKPANGRVWAKVTRVKVRRCQQSLVLKS